MNLIKSILYYSVVIFLVLYILLVSLNPEKMMDVLGFRTFIVLSDSMEPKINVNDMIFSKRVSEDELEIGDIITFEVYIPQFEEKVFVTHYVGDLQEVDGVQIIKTRGLNLALDQFDGWVDEDGEPYNIEYSDIKGEYMFKLPYVGYIQTAFNNKIILGLILLNAGIVYLAVKLLKKNNEDTEEFE